MARAVVNFLGEDSCIFCLGLLGRKFGRRFACELAPSELKLRRGRDAGLVRLVLVARAAMAASSSADGASGADSSCFCEKVANLQLQLSPAYLGNEDAGVREQLRLALLRYVDSLGGVVVSYSELRFTSPLGTIREDAPHIHVNVSVRVVLFAPRVGQRLDGELVRVGADGHMALLVHGLFNATVFAAAGAAGRAAGSRVRFVVRELQVADGLLSMIGDEAGAAPPRKRARDGDGGDGGDGAGSKKKKSKRGDKQARDRQRGRGTVAD